MTLREALDLATHLPEFRGAGDTTAVRAILPLLAACYHDSARSPQLLSGIAQSQVESLKGELRVQVCWKTSSARWPTEDFRGERLHLDAAKEPGRGGHRRPKSATGWQTSLARCR